MRLVCFPTDRAPDADSLPSSFDACFEARNICIMAGAGISTNAGIPGGSLTARPVSTRLTADILSFLCQTSAHPRRVCTPTCRGSTFPTPRPSSTFLSSRTSLSHSSRWDPPSSPIWSSYRSLIVLCSSFAQLAKELFPGQYLPTATHYFFKLLHTKGLLKRCFTQNIDTLERIAVSPQDVDHRPS